MTVKETVKETVKQTVREKIKVDSQTETITKAVLYRIYATMLTSLFALIIFKPEYLMSVGIFGILDIIGGFITYYTFERFWVTVVRRFQWHNWNLQIN